jgi:hypothetical protein
MNERMSRKAIALIGLVALLVALAGCAAASPQTAEAPAAPGRDWAEKSVMATPAAAPAEAYGGESAGLHASPPAAKPMIIQMASLGLVVSDTSEALEKIKDLVAGLGGYIANSNAYEDGEWMRAYLTLRVPAENLPTAIDQIKALAVKVQRENLSGQDVTEEYTDKVAQLRNLEATEKELLALLTEVREKPNSTAEDILDVHRRVTEIRGEIELVKGRMQYLEQMTAFATIDVELTPDPLAQPVVEPGWAPLRTLSEASRSLVRTLKRLVDVLIWIVVVVLPILLVIAIPIALLVLLIRWLVRRSRARRQAKAEEAEAARD